MYEVFASFALALSHLSDAEFFLSVTVSFQPLHAQSSSRSTIEGRPRDGKRPG
jgi:hypothetical protein